MNFIAATSISVIHTVCHAQERRFCAILQFSYNSIPQSLLVQFCLGVPLGFLSDLKNSLCYLFPIQWYVSSA